jgi:hypothetical protein
MTEIVIADTGPLVAYLDRRVIPLIMPPQA